MNINGQMTKHQVQTGILTIILALACVPMARAQNPLWLLNQRMGPRAGAPAALPFMRWGNQMPAVAQPPRAGASRFPASTTSDQNIINTVAGSWGPTSGTAVSLGLENLVGVAIDGAGNFYITESDFYRVYKVTASGQLSTVAGTGGCGFTGDGGPASSAALCLPTGLALDASGNLFIADVDDNRIRRVDAATGIITTVAGNGSFCTPSTDPCGDGGPATSASLGIPYGVAVDATGNLFIADTLDYRVRRVDAATGIITTVAGNGGQCYPSTDACGDGGPATSAELAQPYAVAIDASGNLFIADAFDYRVRRVDASTVAGNGVQGFSGDGGPATSAELAEPLGVAVDASGNLFIADSANERIRRVDAATGIITTVAGNGAFGFGGDGGPATSAELSAPYGVAVDASSILFIADTYNLRIRSVNLAPVATLSATNLTFGDQLVGTTSAAQTVTLTNSGLASLSITSIAPSGDFGQTNTCGASVAPSLSCTISVTFTPTVSGTRTGSITITDNASDSPQSISLTGTGTSGVATLNPTSLTFATQLVGTTSKSKNVTLTNSGTGALTITSIASSGDFSETSPSCPISPSTLAAGANCTIIVTFKPTAVGARTGTVTVTDNNNGVAGSTQTVSLTGTGTVVRLAPASLNFGSVPVGTTSGAKKVTLTNEGATSLSITSIALKGADSKDSAQTNTCGASIGAGASRTFTVTFKPQATGNRSAVISISDNGGGSPQTVSLSGTGT